MKLDEFKPETTCLNYIAAPPEKVWRALTCPELTPQYFFGRRIEITLEPGGCFRLWQPGGVIDVEGQVAVCDPPRKLVVTWRVVWIEELRRLPESLVTYQLDDLGQVTLLTVTEAHRVGLDKRLLEAGRRGWPLILSNLKTMIETGSAMPRFDFMRQLEATLEEMKAAASGHPVR